MSSVWLPLVLIAMLLPVALLLSRYNALVRSRKRVQEAWFVVELQLRRRASLVPNILETVRGYAEHERKVFERVARARGAMQTADGANQTGTASTLLSQALDHLFAVVENHPQLRASANFLRLWQDMRDAEDKIAFARQFYNCIVLDYNTRLVGYPESLLASRFGFTAAELFETDDEGHSAYA